MSGNAGMLTSASCVLHDGCVVSLSVKNLLLGFLYSWYNTLYSSFYPILMCMLRSCILHTCCFCCLFAYTANAYTISWSYSRDHIFPVYATVHLFATIDFATSLVSIICMLPYYCIVTVFYIVIICLSYKCEMK